MLEKIKIGVSSLTNQIYLCRYGKQKKGKPDNLPIEKRPAEVDVIMAIIQHYTFKSPSGSVKIITLDGERYEISVKRLSLELDVDIKSLVKTTEEGEE